MTPAKEIKVNQVWHAGQWQMYDERKRINVGACGRRFGKTFFGIDLLAEEIAAGPYPVAWFAPSYKDLADVWREINDYLKPLIRDKNEQQHWLKFGTGATLDCWSVDNPDSGRGRKYKRVVVDEAGKVKDLQYVFAATIQPTLADYSGDAWLFGTPKGMNYFYTLFRMGQNADDPDFKSWQMPTAMNPKITPEEIAFQKRTTPALFFAQEYEAAFLEDGSGVFEKIMQSATAPWPREPYHGTFAMGTDWGQTGDYTVSFVIDVKTGDVVDYDRFTGLDFRDRVNRVKSMYFRWKPAMYRAEKNSIGRDAIDQLIRENVNVVPFLTTNQSKQDIVGGLALGFALAQIRIPNESDIINELLAFQLGHTPSGLPTYSAPEGLHDDIPMALAITWQAVKDLGGGWGASVGAEETSGWREVVR